MGSPLNEDWIETVNQQFQWVGQQRKSPGSWLLVQDNAPIHRSNAVKECLNNFEHEVETPDWLPYSPYLNPIENTWAYIEKVYKGGQRPRDIPELNATIHSAWWEITTSELMAGRIQKSLTKQKGDSFGILDASGT